jgi:hypothetical protein
MITLGSENQMPTLRHSKQFLSKRTAADVCFTEKIYKLDKRLKTINASSCKFPNSSRSGPSPQNLVRTDAVSRVKSRFDTRLDGYRILPFSVSVFIEPLSASF